MLVKYISSDGVENEVEDSSVAASIMRNDSSFRLISSGNNPTETLPHKVPAAIVETTLPDQANPVTAKLIRSLMLVQKEKTWKKTGHKSFGDYLDSDQVPHFGKTKFYKLRDLLAAEGDVRFDRLMRS